MDRGKTECCFLWLSENYSYSSLSFGKLVSPDFVPQGLGGSSWNISLLPGVLKWKKSFHDSLSLKRSAQDAGPENFLLNFELSIVKADGSILYSEESEHAFRKGDERGFKAYVDMDEFYERRNTDFLPGDTLGVRCRMWRGGGSVQSVTQWTSRTRIGVKKVSFIHRVGNFSALKQNEVKTIEVPIYSNNKGCVFSSRLYISDTFGTLDVQIVPSDRDYKIINMKLSLLDVFGNTVEIGEVDYRFSNFLEDRDKLERRFTKQFLLDKRGEYLPNDELSLLCECTFITSGVEDGPDEAVLEMPLAEYNRRYNSSCRNEDRNLQQKTSDHPSVSEGPTAQPDDHCLTNVKSNTSHKNSNAPSTSSFVAFSPKTNSDPQKDKYSTTEKLSKCPSALDDFKALYTDQLLTDVELKTATKSFPAHRNELSARSSVFRAMLTTDMREKNTDCTLHVDDLEDDTLERLLLFLYSDHLQELTWESALRLYYAADKYAVERLKVLCSAFLLDSIDTANACELLADTHGDAGLKRSVEDFILEHDEEIFRSVEWEKFSETNPQLANKTMKLKYKKKKEGK